MYNLEHSFIPRVSRRRLRVVVEGLHGPAPPLVAVAAVAVAQVAVGITVVAGGGGGAGSARGSELMETNNLNL
jgi:pseudouridine-5'-phosphate glycosidase